MTPTNLLLAAPFRTILSGFAALIDCLMSADSQRMTALCGKTGNQGGESFGVKAVGFLMFSFTRQSQHTLPPLSKAPVVPCYQSQSDFI